MEFNFIKVLNKLYISGKLKIEKIKYIELLKRANFTKNLQLY